MVGTESVVSGWWVVDRKELKMVRHVLQIAMAACALLASVHAQVSAQTKGAKPATNSGHTPSTAAFAPLEQWKAAVLSGDAAKLRAIYSTNPAARVVMQTGEAGAETEVAFWTGLKVRRMKIDLKQSESPQSGLQQVAFEAEVVSAAQSKPQTVYVIDGQLWQKQGEQWRIVATQRGAPSKLQQPLDTSKNIYIPGLNAHAEIAQALKLATQQHKRVLVVFGANWCYDCHVLDLAFHRPDVAAVLGPNFEVVHVDVGEYDKNLDIMQQFQVPKERGIPAIAVLDSSGKLLYSQKGGEFEKARSLSPEDVLAFLNQWKPS
jgi:Thioredoxin-like